MRTLTALTRRPILKREKVTGKGFCERMSEEATHCDRIAVDVINDRNEELIKEGLVERVSYRAHTLHPTKGWRSRSYS